MKTLYETNRLWLQILTKDDSKAVAEYHKNNREEMAEWMPIRPDIFYTESGQRELLWQEWLQTQAGNQLKLWLFEKDTPDRIIGYLAFTNIVRGGFRSCFLGYQLQHDFRGRGYMTESLKRAIEIVFGEWELHRIEANIMPRNERSIKLVAGMGFQNEGLSPKYLKINGVWEDHIHMVLLNEAVE